MIGQQQHRSEADKKYAQSDDNRDCEIGIPCEGPRPDDRIRMATFISKECDGTQYRARGQDPGPDRNTQCKRRNERAYRQNKQDCSHPVYLSLNSLMLQLDQGRKGEDKDGNWFAE